MQTTTETLRDAALKPGGRPDVRALHTIFPEEQLVDLRRRIKATRWPERETVSDDTQGVQLATMQALATYWANDYDW
ncbi:MAG TPA: epoxide hydrolase N-terminal domain-containing protein, partial [Burkholderiales bacterium]|nr:epoxide hydrolase N-terminal domain-containing protein [Burkholderiales bacterium]